jgi:hypothetical protein
MLELSLGLLFAVILVAILYGIGRLPISKITMRVALVVAVLGFMEGLRLLFGTKLGDSIGEAIPIVMAICVVAAYVSIFLWLGIKKMVEKMKIGSLAVQITLALLLWLFGFFVGRHNPPHHYEIMPDKLLMDSTTGKICNPYADALRQEGRLNPASRIPQCGQE